MNKHFCDKCGKETKDDWRVETTDWEGSKIEKLFDLCKECFQGLKKFLTNHD